MKRVFSLFLCLTLLLSSVALLSSCSKSKDGEPKISSKIIDVDLSEYSVVYAADISTNGRTQVTEMTKTLAALTTLSLRNFTDTDTTVVQTDTKEILIGSVNRKETVKTLNSLGDLGWGIRVFDNKIVIVGTTPFLTRVALAYFVNNYLTADSVKGTVISVNQKVTAAKLETIAFTENDAAAYSVIIDDRTDTDTASQFGGTPNDSTVDTAFTLAESVQSDLAGATGMVGRTFKVKIDTDEVTDKEILIGDIDRPEMQEVLATMDAKDYAVSIRNGKIMIAAWNDVALDAAYGLFQSMISESTVTDEDGNKEVLIPTWCTMRMTLTSDWVTDFPRPTGDGIALSGMVDVEDNSIEYVYTGTGVNRENYVAYCSTLESAGYALLEGSSETQWEGSSFRTYLNKNTGVTLQVSHYAYTHAAAQNITNFENCFRIIASTADSSTLPSKDLLNPNQSYNKVTETKVTALKLNYAADAYGMAYALTLEDGSFIVFDGGGTWSGATKDEENMWNVLTALHEEAFGEPADETNPVHIRAWIITHEHGDHTKVFRDFISKYGKRKDLRLDALLANFASDTELVNTYNPNTNIRSNLKTHQDKVRDHDGDGDGFDYIKVHTGQVFYMANAKLEVMYTHEDIYPQKLEFYNSASTVFRITQDSTNQGGVTKSRASCLWLGDAGPVSSYCLRAMYGTALSGESYAATFKDSANVSFTQMVQVAHHGGLGVEAEFYNLLESEVVWCPATKDGFANKFEKPEGSFAQKASYAALNGEKVKLFIMSDVYNTTLIIDNDGAQYNGLKDAITGEAVGAVANCIIYK